MIGINNATYSDPTIHFLTQILTQVREGGIKVPRFQRPFIWEEDRQLELLRSIRQGIPIGAIMVWKTSEATVRYYDNLGGLPVAVKGGGISQQYLLDGVQRISTLYRAMASVEDFSSRVLSSEDSQIPHFSFREDDFVFADFDASDPALMPLYVVSDTLSLIKYQRRLAQKGNDSWLATSDDISRAFRDYKVPIIPIATDDLDVATLTFQRINSQGEEMSDLHMIHALTWSSEFDLLESLESVKDELLGPKGWQHIDNEVILKVCKGFYGLNLYKTEPKALGNLLRRERGLLERAVAAIASTADIFRFYLGIKGAEEIPYSFQIVFPSLVPPGEGEEDKNLFVDWFWFTTYAEAFSGMSDDRVKRTLADFEAMIRTGRPVWSDRRKVTLGGWRTDRIDFRTVRTKATLLNLARRIEEHTEKDAFEELHYYGRDSLQSILGKASLDRAASSIGNRCLARPDEMVGIRDRWERRVLTEAEANAHFLTNDFDFSDPLSGIESRGEKITQYMVHHMHSTAGVFLDRVKAN